MFCFQVFIVIAIIGSNNGDNILGFLPVPLHSHIKGFLPIFVELAKRGHNVTVVSPYSMADTPQNYHQIIVKKALKEIDFTQFQLNKVFQFITTPFIMWSFMLEMLEDVFGIPEIQNFIHSNDSQFDLVMIEQFYQESVIAIGHKFGAPVINLSPVTLPSTCKWVGNSMNPSYMADVRLSYTDKMSFTERVKSAINWFVQIYLEELIYIPKQEALMNKYFNYTKSETRPSLKELLKNVTLTLIHADSVLSYYKPHLPSFVEMSGMYIPNSQKLPQDLQKIMDDAENGVIYFSLGSVANPKYLPKERIEALLRVFAKLPQRVLMKLHYNHTCKIPDNVLVQNWLPQIDILAHSNCKLFITHGGLHSIIEAVHFGVPILGFPLFADQETNMLFTEEKGFGMMSNFYTFTTDTLHNDISLLVNDSKYSNAAKEISVLYHDKPMASMENIIYWIEYVLRHNGAAHLKSPAIRLHWYQLYLLDILAIIIIVFITIVTCLYYVVIFIRRKLQF